MDKIFGIFTSNDLGFKQIYLSDFLEFFDFSYVKYTSGFLGLKDNLGANMGEIDDDRFFNSQEGIKAIVERLDTYYEDYVFNPIVETFEDELNIEPVSTNWDVLWKQALLGSLM